ncbi:MAG TPA: hypothetical protein VI756_26435 [Blastocatellia bacterium]
MRANRLIATLLLSAVPAAILSGVLILGVESLLDPVVIRIANRIGPHPTCPPGTTQTADFYCCDCSGCSDGSGMDGDGLELGTGLGLFLMWLTGTGLLIVSLDRFVEYSIERNVLGKVRACDPTPTDLGELTETYTRIGLVADSAVCDLARSIISGLYRFDIKVGIGLNRSNLMRKYAVEAWSTTLNRSNVWLFMMAIAAPAIALTFTMIQLCSVMDSVGDSWRDSSRTIALGVGHSLEFVVLGAALGLAALFLYRSVRRRHECLVSGAEDFTFELLVACRRRAVGTEWPVGCSSLFQV